MADRPTSADVFALRNADIGAGGLEQCKARLLKEWRLARLREISLAASELYTVEACNDVIRDLVAFIQQVEIDHD